MAKYTARVNRLYNRTHMLVSARSSDLLLKYYVDRYTDTAKTGSFESNWAEFIPVWKRYMHSKCPDGMLDQLRVIMRKDPAVFYKAMIELSTPRRDLRGQYLPNHVGKKLRAAVLKAKRSFEG